MAPNEAIERFISQLDTQITAANELNSPEIKLLLSMARLELQMRLHGISGHELRALCSMLELALSKHESGKVKAAKRKNSNDIPQEPKAAVSNVTRAIPNAGREAGRRENLRPQADRRFLSDVGRGSGRLKRRRK